jgi:hypothetical protein
MLVRHSHRRLPLWVYAGIAAILVGILAVGWSRADTLTRAELLIPAAFWTAAFVVIALRRWLARS